MTQQTLSLRKTPLSASLGGAYECRTDAPAGKHCAVVEQISADKKAVRVRSGSRLLTAPRIRWNVTAPGHFSIWLPPSIGEQVWIGCRAATPENAFVIGSAYSADSTNPGGSLLEIIITAPDGIALHYDATKTMPGALAVTGIKTAHIQARNPRRGTPEVECTNHLKTRTFELTHGSDGR
ncbi:phage baseplate assembly protein V [Klebsiella pneumoniae subsp. pneumoniae]|nr:phage baseplate assembly protein V [Klebsiella pneumoniae subsp. pneumoniae]